MSTTSAIVVMSRGREELLLRRKLILHWLQKCSKYPVFLAVRESELGCYAPVFSKFDRVKPLTIPDYCNSWGLVRDYIVTDFSMRPCKKLAICDDDITFSCRDWDENYLYALHPDATQAAFDALFAELNNDTPLAGFRSRAFAQNATNKVDKNKRIMWIHGIHIPTFEAEGFTFGWDGITQGDFYCQLSVISAGYNTATINSFCIDDAIGPHNDRGGCNLYRTAEMRSRSARMLAERFPEAVTLIEKSTPSGNFLDVRVNFNKVVRR